MSEDDFYCGDDEEKPLEENMVECNLCGKKSFGNEKPQPFAFGSFRRRIWGKVLHFFMPVMLLLQRMLLPRNADPFVMAEIR